MKGPPVQPDDRQPPELNAETLAAYIDGRLDRETATQVETMLLRDSDWYATYIETIRAKAALGSDVSRPRPAIGRAYQIAAGALTLAASVALFFLWQRQAADPDTHRERQALVAAVGTERRFEPRVTGGFAHAPLSGPVRSGANTDVPLEIRTAALALEQANRDRPAAATLAALGVARLFSGHADEAVRDLEEALRGNPADGRVQSDLAAAYLVRARDGDARLAYEAAAKATAASPRLPEAWFNRALAAERLSLPADAKASWQRASELDGDTAWAAEARQHLERLSKQQSRNWPEARSRLTAVLDNQYPVGQRRHDSARRQARNRTLFSPPASLP